MRKTVNSRKMITSQLYTMFVGKCHYMIYSIGIGTGLMLSKQFKVLLIFYIRPIKCKVVETNLEPII